MTPAHLLSMRKSLGLSQTEMAEELGLSLADYRNLESGRCAILRLHALAVERLAMARVARAGGEPMALPLALLMDVIGIYSTIDGTLPEPASTATAKKQPAFH